MLSEGPQKSFIVTPVVMKLADTDTKGNRLAKNMKCSQFPETDITGVPQVFGIISYQMVYFYNKYDGNIDKLRKQ